MKPPQQFSHSSPEGDSDSEFVQELQEVERSLVSLKERYNQVESDREHKSQLQQRRQDLQQSKNPTSEIKAELRQIKQQLEVLEINLESQLFSWRSFKKPFWQAVRFGGMGVIIGWILKSCVR